MSGENHHEICVEDVSIVVNGEPSNRSAESSSAETNTPEPVDETIREDSATDGSGPSLATGLSSIISSVIKSFDSRAEDTLKSQDQLSFAVDRLTGELDQLLEDAPLPFIMQHAARISGVRKRVSSLNTVLKSVQRRIDNIDRLLSAELLHGKATIETVEKEKH